MYKLDKIQYLYFKLLFFKILLNISKILYLNQIKIFLYIYSRKPPRLDRRAFKMWG